jgi:arylsulfatase A-like enzyme
VKPGVSDALVCQIDLFASLASLLGQSLPEPAAPDSKNVLPALLGESSHGRDEFVHQANGLALREGRWKFIPGRPGARVNANTNTETGADAAARLFDLSTDLGETRDVAADHPDRVKAMSQRLEAIRNAGRSRP